MVRIVEIEMDIDGKKSLQLTALNNEGTAVGAARLASIDKETAWLDNLFVHPSYRRGRVATQLLNYCLRFCEPRPITSISLGVDPKNEAAKSLYADFDFKLSYLYDDGYNMMTVFLK